MGDLKVSYRYSSLGFNVRVNKNSFVIVYPRQIWSSFPQKIKKEVVENFVFLATQSLPLVLQEERIDYKMSTPLFKSFFISPLLNYLPLAGDMSRKKSFSLIKSLMNTDYCFTSSNSKNSAYELNAKDKAIILFTFGKDSLLNYAVSKEIGLKPIPVYIEEPDIKYIDSKDASIQNMYERVHKQTLIKKFSTKFKTQVHKINNGLGITRYPDFFNVTTPDMGWSSQLTEYALLTMPFNHYYKAKYLVYGNEASCSQEYWNLDGFRVNPVFDQTKQWTLEITKLLRLMTKNVLATSFVEPLHELAIMKILHHRYPQYSEFQMSCFADSNSAKNSRWCHSCSKCARMFVFMKALGIDPKTVSFNKNLFSKASKTNYSIFTSRKKDLKPYDFSGLGRDEQLFAFYLAYKNNSKGYLIDLFKKKYLDEVLDREDEFYKEFFSLHTFDTIPRRIANKLKSVYQEELESL
ncbi:MAG: hypothetical protein ABIC91_07835 [Nanoarchaeota archaeon]|nr:hypothetical protein [Nanoarchaeota archaeon]MBU1031262.1 hypothetical protein [Nanoarchaeota archaeon]